MNDLLASLMTYDNPEDVRFILLDYLLALRYRLGERQQDDWCLGQGKLIADETLTGIEVRLVGRKDVMGLRSIFDDLRTVFDLPERPNTVTSGYKARHRAGPQAPRRASATPNRASRTPSAGGHPEAHPPTRNLESQASIRSSERGHSFDLDQYLQDISPLGDETVPDNWSTASPAEEWIFTQRVTGRLSATSGSVPMTASLLINPSDRAGSRSAHCSSMLSVFTIKQARREYHQETSATQLQLPRRAISLDELEAPRLCNKAGDESGGDEDSSGTSATGSTAVRLHQRGSRSETDLLETRDSAPPTDPDEADDIRAIDPASMSSHSLRRVSRLRGRLNHHISAYELGLAHALPRIPATPTLPLDFDAVEDFCGTPIAVPTVPPVSLLPKASPAPESSCSGSLRIAVNKNLAGLDTPPASPPLVDSATISCSLSVAPYKTSPGPSTPLGKCQRQIHRHCAVVDGAHVSPPRNYPSSVDWDDESEHDSTVRETPGPRGGTERSRRWRQGAGLDGSGSAAVAINNSMLDPSAMPQAESGLSLSTIMGLFETARGQVAPREGLQDEDVRKVIKDIVRSRRAGNEQQRWLLSELAKLVSVATAFILVELTSSWAKTLHP